MNGLRRDQTYTRRKVRGEERKGITTLAGRRGTMAYLQEGINYCVSGWFLFGYTARAILPASTPLIGTASRKSLLFCRGKSSPPTFGCIWSYICRPIYQCSCRRGTSTSLELTGKRHERRNLQIGRRSRGNLTTDANTRASGQRNSCVNLIVKSPETYLA